MWELIDPEIKIGIVIVGFMVLSLVGAALYQEYKLRKDRGSSKDFDWKKDRK